MRTTVLRGALYAGGAYALSAVVARPWMDRWGSTAEERALILAGDELVPDAEQQTHAITIEAPPEAVWPWLVQMGQGRAGFYSHDRLERLVGADIHNAAEIHPEWQHLAVGDLVRTYRPIPRFEPLGWLVGIIDPPRLLIVHEPERAGIINSSWAFVLERDGERTRLLSRWRFRRRGAAHTAFKWCVFDPAHFIMETGVLHGLKTRVERQAALKRPNPGSLSELAPAARTARDDLGRCAYVGSSPASSTRSSKPPATLRPVGGVRHLWPGATR
jgi:hypothetical protein